MSEQIVTVRIAIVRKLKKKCTDPFAEDSYEDEYDLWVVVTGLPAAGVTVIFENAEQTPREILLRIREATSDTAAEKVTGMAWRITGLSASDTKSLLWDLPDKVQTRIQELLSGGLAETGSPIELSGPVADVGATLLLKPVLGPATEVIHVAEVVAIIGGALVGAHALVAGALNALMHDKISSTIAEAIDHTLAPLDDATEPPRATDDAADAT